jgi:hypothetical protein
MMTPPEPNLSTVMVAKVRQLMSAVPFRPFVVVTTGGKSYTVASTDHIAVTGLLHRVCIDFDDGTVAEVNPLHIAAVEVPGKAA